MIRFLITAVALFSVFSFYSPAQFYTTGENPASIKWEQIKTRNFRIIYPSGLSNDAVRLAHQLEFSFSNSGEMQKSLRKPFPVLMQNGSVQSNGYVTMAPSRMELQITPPQDSYAQDWISQLSLHEFRHVAQLNMLDSGITGIFRFIAGEISRGIVSAQIPSWFYEGDAVHFETRLSYAGRGRSAGFEMPLRTLLTEGREYSYDKAIFGSYRDFVPDNYAYGYPLTGYLRSHYGKYVWADALGYVSRNPYQIWPLSFYLKKHFGFYKSGLYSRMVDSLRLQYNNPVKSANHDNGLYDKSKNGVYTNYLYPMQFNSDIIAFRQGLGDPGTFVRIDSSGREIKLTATGRIFIGKADIIGSRIVWNEIVADPRWEKRDFSVIKEFDILTGKKRAVTRNTRYFSPDFSPDGSKIAVAENDLSNRNYLTIINADNGSVIQRFPILQDGVLTPDWCNMEEIAFITVSSEGKQLESVNLKTGVRSVYIAHTNNNISDPFNYDNFIVFRAEQDGIENLFVIDKNSGDIFQLTNSAFGARHPSLTSDKKILFADYSGDGFKIKSTDFVTVATNRYTILAPDTSVTRTSVKTAYITEPYSYNKTTHLFRFHSWLPFYTDINELRSNIFDSKVSPGIIIFSQNTLSTAISTIGYSFTEGNHYLHSSFIWRGWYPVLEFNAHYGGPQRILSVPGDSPLPGNLNPNLNFMIRAYVPLMYSHGAFTTYIRPDLEYEFFPVWYDYHGEFRKGFGLLHLKFMVSNYQRMAVRDLYPRWGQSLNASFSFQPSGHIFGRFYSGRVNFFFPGLFRHHHFMLRAGYQHQYGGDYLLPYARLNIPRGYPLFVSERFLSLNLNYSFPFLYPDLALGPVLYIKRLRSELFWDFSFGTGILDAGSYHTSKRMQSAGTEIIADFHAARMIFPLSAGIRLGYRVPENQAFAEFMIQINTNL